VVFDGEDIQDSQDRTQIHSLIMDLMYRFKQSFYGIALHLELTASELIRYLSLVIELLLPPLVPLSPSSSPESSQSSQSSQSESRPQTDSRSTAQEILEAYNYFKDDSFDDDDIPVVYDYIMNPGRWMGNLKGKINNGRPRGMTKLRGGSSLHNTKRQHRKKQKIKSRRRKNKYNKTKTRKNRN
jgi:hypothetical protein